MSDQQPGEWFQSPHPAQPPGGQGAANWAPPQGPAVQMPSAATSYQAPEAFNFESETVQKKGAPVGRLAVVGLSLALIGGAGFAIKTALSNPAGPSSPNEAADALFQSLDDDDFVGVVELMAPSEREAYVEPSLDILTEFARLTNNDVGDDVFNQLPFDIEVDGVEYQVTELGPGVSWLEVTAGTMAITFNSDEIPEWASDVSERLDTPANSQTETFNLRDEGMAFAMVEQDGSWYWSGGYTIAENIRADSGWGRPSFTGTDMARGADSPEEAVENMVYSLTDFDLRGAFTLLDPQEFGVLYDYSEFFLDDAAAEFSDLRTELDQQGIEYSITDLAMKSSEVRGRTVVSVETFAASATDGTDSGTIEFRDGCIRIEVPQSETIDTCNEADLWNEVNGGGLSDGLNASFADFKSGITVVERDGKWYVSGGPTVLGFYADVLAALTEDDWNNFTESLGGITDLIDGSFGGLNPYALGSGDDWTTIDDYDYADDSAQPNDGSFPDDETTPVDEEYVEDFEYEEMNPVYIAPSYDFWTDHPNNSVGVFMYDLDAPLNVVNLYKDAGFMELAEYELPYDAKRLAASMAEAYGCAPIDAGVMGEGVVRYSCNDGLVVQYGRWMMYSFESSEETEAMALDQLAHLRSIGE